MYLSKIDFSFDIYDEFFSFVFIIACNPWLINNHVFLAINEKSSISDNTIRLYSKNVKTNKLSKSLKCLYQYSRKLTASIIVTQPSSVMQSMLWLFGCLVLSYLSQVEPIFQMIIINASEWKFCAFVNNRNNFDFTITGSEFDLNSESKASVPTTTSYLQLLQLSEDDTSVANPSLSQNKTKVYISSTESIVETL